MPESRMTTRGRTTVPPTIREHLAVQPGARLVWQLMPTGTVSVRVKGEPAEQSAGGRGVQAAAPAPPRS
ncbi:MAG: AbrB family transcriptional regulator [Burkholderiales bacterium]|nr:AbrB family transcriptional regulator [Burkholderiales bacterium]